MTIVLAKNNPLLLLILFWGCGLLLQSCKDDSEGLKASRGEIVEFSVKQTLSVETIQTSLKLTGLDLPIEKAQYPVTYYDVEYYTKYKGVWIVCSGRVYIPETENEVSFACFSHGTIGSDAEAMTSLSAITGTNIFLSGLASMGLVVVAPDLVGFGASSDRVHPYYVESATASATIDNIYAASALAQQLNLNADNDLYLMGYSQGGYSTMSTHKSIEEEGIETLNLVASFPASGGYNIRSVQDYFFDQETYHQPFYMAYVANAYFDYYDWAGDYSLNMFFKEPYASQIPDLLDGSLTGSQINARLTDIVADYIDADYLASPDANEYAFLIEAYEENSPTDWVPKVPLHMYHGNEDITVPYRTSVEVYNDFIAEGSSTSVVTFTALEGGTHATGVAPYIEDVISKLVILENL